MTKGEQTKNKIIETAGDLFWRNGYANTGVSEILKEAGVPKGSFYFHFEKKSDVAKAVIQYYNYRTIEVLHMVAERSDNWSVFCDSFLKAFEERLGDKKCYGCPLAVLGMELAFQDITLAKEYSKALESLKDVFVEVLNKENISEIQKKKMAELSLAIYEGNLVLHRVSKDQRWLYQMNEQLKQILELQ